MNQEHMLNYSVLLPEQVGPKDVQNRGDLSSY